MKTRLKDVADAIGARVIGGENAEISGLASIASAKPGDLVFVEDEKHLPAAFRSNATAVIAGEFANGTNSSKPLLLVANPRLAFARSAALLQGAIERKPEVSSAAIVMPSAVVAETAIIDPWVFIGAGASISAGSWIGAGAVVGSEVTIGEDCKIYPRVTVYPGTHVGNRVIVHAGAVLGSDGFGYVRDPDTGYHEKFPQIGKLIIEDDVEIGANTTIDRGALETTRIGHGTKIDNLVHIGHNCQIGTNVIIAAQAGFSGSITIENNVVIGGQVGVGEHARIEEGVLLGGQAGVLPKKILRGKGIAFWGTPAKPLREYLKQLAAVTKLGRKA